MALADDISAFANGQRFPDVMVGNQHAEAAVAQVFNNTFDVDNGNGVNAGEGFIKQDEFRISGQRAGDFNAAAFTTGERLTETVAQVLNVKLFHELFRAIFTLFGAQVVANLQYRHQVIVYAQAAKNRGFLREIADSATRARVQRQQANIFVIDDNVPCVARYDANDHIEGGRFTGAVWAEKAYNLARVHGQTDIFHDAAAFIGFSKVLCS